LDCCDAFNDVYLPIERAMTAKPDTTPGVRRLLFLWIALLACLLWPAALNRGAFLFPDTPTYFRGADAAVFKLTGQQTAWTEEFFKSYPLASGAAQKDASTSAPESAPELEKVVLSGRSIYFGFIVYVLDLLGGAWFIVATQACVSAAALALVVRRIVGSNLATSSVALIAAMVGFSSAGFFTALVMPDWLAPLSIAGGALVLSSLGGMSNGERIFWFALIAFALLSHSANIIILAGMTALYVCVARTVSDWRKYAFLGATIFVALFGEAAFSIAVKHQTGFAPVRPPFLSARIIDDGPGYVFLTHRCPAEKRLAVCAFLDRLPVHSDTFLWAAGDNGVFSASPSTTKRLLSAQDTEIFTRSFLFAPASFADAMAANVFEQTTRNGLEEFNGVITDPKKLTPAMNAHAAATRATSGTMPVRPLGALFLAGFLLALAAIAVLCAMRRRLPGVTQQSVRFCALVIAGVAIDVVVCAAFSTPHDRYFARVMWLAPFTASLLAVIAGQAMRRDRAPMNAQAAR
jgi:hypothetical protein